jgi:hypothetical protein
VPNADVNQVVRNPPVGCTFEHFPDLIHFDCGQAAGYAVEQGQVWVIKSGSDPGIGKRILEEEGGVCLRAEAVCHG